MAKSFNTLLSSMSGGPSKPLFIEMETYCRKNQLDVVETFFGGDTAPKIVALWKEDTEFMEWMVPRTQPATKGSGRGWFYPQQPRAEIVAQSVDIVSKNFVSHRDGAGGAQSAYVDYRVIDAENRVVEPICQGADQMRDIARTIAKAVKEEDDHELSLKEARDVWDFATVHGKLTRAKPVVCAQPGENVWCLHRMTVVADDSVPFEETLNFLARINDPEAFAAWMYGVASGLYRGRQVLWLRGRGSDGKSSFFKAFASVFGVAAGAVDWNQLKSNASFAGSLFVNKRFVYVPDNNNAELLNSALFKSLSDPGSDPVVINHKYGKMYSTELDANTAILSNARPNIRNETHSLSRALYLEIEPRDLSVPADKTITDRFIAELPGFLAFGKSCYENLCVNNTEIRVNSSASSAIEDRVAATGEKYEMILHKYFVVEEGVQTPNADIYPVLKEDARLNDHEVGEFRDWLFSNHGVEWRQVRHGTDRQRNYVNLRLKTASDRKKAIIANDLSGDIVTDEVA